jgi:hypothetical protein
MVENSFLIGLIKKKWSARADYFLLFLVCSFPVHIWAYLNLLRDMPAILLEMGIWRILGVAAYVLVFAFLESLLIFLVLLLFSFTLPEKIFGLKLIHVGSILVFSATISVLFIHLYNQLEIDSLALSTWIVIWILAGFSLFTVSVYWLKRNRRAEAIFRSGIERLAILSLLYIFLDFLGLFLIIIRNIVSPL